jgi:hypothetical protein
LHADHGVLYAGSGGGLYTVTSAAVATLRGAYGSSTEVDMDSSATALVVVSPPLAYSYTPATTTFAQITDADFLARGSGDVELLDGYFLHREPSTRRFFHSDLNSATAYDALNFATKEGASDALVGLKADHLQALLAGERTCEFWRNAGTSGSPFERMENGLIELGCANGKTIAKLDNSIYLVASDYTVRRFDGFTPVRVSDHALEAWLKTVTLVSLRGYSYTQLGHLWYVLTAPEGCFAFDVVTQSWSERQSYGFSTWNWGNPVAAFGKILVGSTVSNVIAELSASTYAELAETHRCEWTYQPIRKRPGHRRQFHHSLEVEMEVGVGLTSGQGVDPRIMLDISDDSGKTWRAMPTKTIGALGNYRTTVRWSGLGSSEGTRTYRMAVSDPVKLSVFDAQLDCTGGAV